MQIRVLTSQTEHVFESIVGKEENPVNHGQSTKFSTFTKQALIVICSTKHCEKMSPFPSVFYSF